MTVGTAREGYHAAKGRRSGFWAGWEEDFKPLSVGPHRRPTT